MAQAQAATPGAPLNSPGRRKKPLVTRVWFWAAILVFLLLVAVGLVALWVGSRALAAKDDLEAAIPLATTVQQQIVAGDQAAAKHTAARLQRTTAAARAQTDDPVWKAVEWVPVAGPNLRAIRQVSAVVDQLAADAIVPAADISLDAFQPVDGRIDVQAVRGLVGTVSTAETAVAAAQARLATIDRSGLIDQVNTGIGQLDNALVKAGSLLDGIDGTVRILPGMLGADGPRKYLMIFQNNAEVRAAGGNPAAVVLLTVDDGRIRITKQAASTDFRNNRPAPIIPLDPAVEHIYSKIIGTYQQNITSTPDFPTTAALARAYWAETFGDKPDGVISFDPVALRYLLQVTGPIKLETGDALTADNAVPLLLNEVYFRYTKPKVQDAFFAAAAKSIFAAVTSGKGSTKQLVGALTHAATEGRLLVWSGHDAEEKLAVKAKIAGVLPTSNTDSTVIGAYFNDVTGAKMDYYLDAKVATTFTQCTADAPKLTETVTLTNNLPTSKASSLPAYITGPYYTPGHIGTDVVVYGPVGAKITSWKASTKATVKATGAIGGRPVSRILVRLAPGESTTLTYSMAGAKGAYGPLEVQTTPMVRATPTTVSTPGCAGKK